jgi:PqqD family protein of HPr-rel-A system
LAWRQWQGELVVYNPISGATHVLDVASAEVMLALIERPADLETLGVRLAKLLDIELNAEARAATQGILENLDRLGLAESNPEAEAP